jgi:hypothetical protein
MDATMSLADAGSACSSAFPHLPVSTEELALKGCFGLNVTAFFCRGTKPNQEFPRTESKGNHY